MLRLVKNGDAMSVDPFIKIEIMKAMTPLVYGVGAMTDMIKSNPHLFEDHVDTLEFIIKELSDARNHIINKLPPC